MSACLFDSLRNALVNSHGNVGTLPLIRETSVQHVTLNVHQNITTRVLRITWIYIIVYIQTDK